MEERVVPAASAFEAEIGRTYVYKLTKEPYVVFTWIKYPWYDHPCYWLYSAVNCSQFNYTGKFSEDFRKVGNKK